MKLCVVLLVLVSLAFADELSDCKCLEGYRPQLLENGLAMCLGIQVKAIAPCNLVKKPRCQCSAGVTGILSDAAGVWCVSYSRGRLLKRWRCENTEDWQNFYNQRSTTPSGVNEQSVEST